MNQHDILELLRDIQQRCLFVEDDGTICVTEEPHIDAVLFDRLCLAIKQLTPSP